MATVIFPEKAARPRDPDVARALGASHALWSDLKREIAARHGNVSEEWVFGGKNWGWALRLKQKKRAILYLTPAEGCFRVGFALGERAVQAVVESGLPRAIVDLVTGAPRYVEGRAVRFEVRTPVDVDAALRLAAIKMAH